MEGKKDRGTEGEPPHPKPTTWCAHRGDKTDGKEKSEQKGYRGTKGETPTFDALIGEEKQTGKKREREQRKKGGKAAYINGIVVEIMKIEPLA